MVIWPKGQDQAARLLQLLLGAQVVGVATLLLAAVDGAGVKTGVAPAAQEEPRSTRRSEKATPTRWSPSC